MCPGSSGPVSLTGACRLVALARRSCDFVQTGTPGGVLLHRVLFKVGAGVGCLQIVAFGMRWWAAIGWGVQAAVRSVSFRGFRAGCAEEKLRQKVRPPLGAAVSYAAEPMFIPPVRDA